MSRLKTSSRSSSPEAVRVSCEPLLLLLQYDVEATLEEIYHGCLKKITHVRKVVDEEGRTKSESHELTIDVHPGLPDGTLFVFEGFVSVQFREPGSSPTAVRVCVLFAVTGHFRIETIGGKAQHHIKYRETWS